MTKIALTAAALLVATGAAFAGSDHYNPNEANRPAASVDTSVTEVTLQRSGGLKPMDVTRVFAADQPPPEDFTRADVERVLSVAQTVVDEDVTVDDLPRNTCCDRYTYQVTITTADGTSRTYATIDGVSVPREFARLLSAMA